MTRITVALGLCLASAVFAQGSCSPSWSANTFVPNGTNGGILALAVFDDGTGPALYVGGTFTVAGPAPVSNVARWNGSSWSDVGGGMNGTVSALAVFDDGTGPALYAGGAFTSAGGNGASHVARWNGTAWSPLGAGTDGNVTALAVFGAGPAAALWVGGYFGFAGSAPAVKVARWNTGGGWSSAGGLPGFTTNGVNAFAVYDDGAGPALFAGGTFVPPPFNANNIWKWNGTAWVVVGTGIITNGFQGPVHALAVHDDGGGPALYAGGNFGTAGGVAASNIAKWNGVSWAALGPGLNGVVTALATYDDGSGPALYASGFITGGIARWNGGAWSAIGAGISGQAWALRVWDDGTGPALLVGGSFGIAGAQNASNIAKLTTFWQSLGADGGLTGTVNALAVHDDGSGPHLYAGGMFTTGALFGATNLAKLTVGGWTPIAAGVDGPILSLAVFDDGGGPKLYAGGGFTTIGGVAAVGIAKWDGATWAPVGGGVASGGYVRAMAVFDDGTGPALYTGGIFSNAGGNPAADFLARWNGSSWSTVGGGVSNGSPYVLAVHDDGSGPALLVGGDFTGAGGVPANRIAKWNGTAWSPLGGGVNGAVHTLTTHLAASGQPLLVAGGDFIQADGLNASRIAAWNGSAWAPLGTGFDDRVLALRTFDDGSGPVLYAGGNFSSAGGGTSTRLAKWNGSAWSPPGDIGGVLPAANLWVRSLVTFDDGSGPALYAGGQFSLVGGVASMSVARRVPGGSPLIRTTFLPQIVYPGGPVTLSVAASGTWPLSYQWHKNGANIHGATGASHQIAAAGPGDAGSYGVVVSNACGTASSNAASLSVIAGLATYGTATAGCAGPPWLAALTAPQVGNAAFFVATVNAPPSQTGLGAVSGAPLGAPFWVSGLAAWIDPASPALFFIPVASDAGGLSVIPAGIPPDPGLAGVTGFVQTAWPDACAGGGLAATNALAVQIVP